jgi:hypothetical protein
MALYILGILTLVSLAIAAYQLLRAPQGPACPRCGMLTDTSDVTTHNVNVLTRFRTQAASCSSCGWSGRQRRAPRPQLAREPARGRRRS